VHQTVVVSAIIAANTFFAGPAHVGDTVTYRVTTTTGAAQETPNVNTVVVTWKTASRVYARLVNGSPGSAVIVTRDGSGRLTMAAPNPNDPTSVTIGAVLDQLNFPGQLAGTLDGSDHTQTTLRVTPPAPASTPSPAPQRSPDAVAVQMNVNLIGSSLSSTLIAEGNTQRSSSAGRSGGRPGGAGGGFPPGGGRQSGGGRRGSGPAGDSGGPSNRGPAIDIALEATFDQDGVLQHETYRETFTTQSSSGPQAVERTITSDQVK